MGLFSKLRKGISKKANDAVDGAISPEKEMDLLIVELEDQRKEALKELLSYKATAKSMEQDIEKYKAEATKWEKKAMTAVKAGDDALAREALQEKKRCLIEVKKITADRNEAAGYAIELNRSRKKVEVQLKMLKLKKNTLATQIAAARGADDPLRTDNELFDKLREAEERIDAQAISAEVDASLESGDGLGGALSSRDTELAMLGSGKEAEAETALAELKAKAARKKQKQLKAGASDE